MELLSVRGVSKSFTIERGIFKSASGAVHALDNVTLSLEAGKTLGVVGESGSGKTTLGKAICGLVTPDGGEILISGKTLAAYSRRELSSKTQMVFQDPFASLNPRLSVGTMLMEAVASPLKETRASAAREMLERVGLPGSILNCYPHQFSGGQRQRIALARVLLRQPELLVADEPLSALDLTTQSQMLSLFVELKKHLKLSIVFISHDIVATSNLADYVVVMNNGRIVEEGETATVLGNPREAYTQRLLASVPVLY